MPDLFQLTLSQVQTENLEGIPLLGMKANAGIHQSGRIAKRVIDLILIVVGAPLILLLSVIIGIAIRLDSPGPILYVQRRVGMDGREISHGQVPFDGARTPTSCTTT